MAETKVEEKVVTPPVVEVEKPAETVVVDPIAEKDKEIAKLKGDLENYKNVALTRLGKLPGDAAFLDKDGKGELTVAEQVRIELLNREIDKAEKDKEATVQAILKENHELRLAFKNQPPRSIGGGSQETVEVKDNILSETQIAELRKRASKIGIRDVDGFVERAKQNLLKKSR